MQTIKKKTPRKFLFAAIKAQQQQLEKFATLLYYSNKERDKLRKYSVLYRLTVIFERGKLWVKKNLSR